jgi:putative drug exporter of the RND superfamily
MAHLLYRLGRWSVRRRRLVASVWLALLIAGVIAASTLAGETNDTFELPGTESQDAIDQLAEEMPGAGGAMAQVVFQAPEGATLRDPTLAAAIDGTVQALTVAPEVVNVTDPLTTGAVAPDGSIGFATVSYAATAGELSDDAKAALEAAPEVARHAGLVVEIGGNALENTPHAGVAEAVGLAAAIIVLLFTFGSVVAAGLPIITALVGVGLGLAGITVATGFVDMNSTAPTLAIMLGLAVGIDYALFIVTRHRQLMVTGLTPEESAARAVGTAGSAVVFAGAVVVIALLGLLVIGIPFLSVMGLAAAGTVGGCVLIAVTLLPALLGFAGTIIDRFRVPGMRLHSGLGSQRDALGLRWGRFARRRAAPVLAVGLAVLSVFAIPALDIEMGLPDNGTKSTDTTERRAFDLLAEGFGPGFNGPLVVAVDTTGSTDPETAVTGVGELLAPLDNVMVVAPPMFNQAGNFAILAVIPETGPSDPSTAALVGDIRSATAGLEATTGATASVTGATAVNIDITDTLGNALPVYALIVVGLALVLLTMVFRSLLVPLKAVLGFLLSVVVSFGATVAVFQWGWLADPLGVDQTGPIISILPILLLGILFGLAMDYELFLVSRIREDYVHNGDARDGVVQGVRHSSRVIIAAGLIMISVFSAFVLSNDPNVKMIGFALAVGVLADAFVVRMTIVPAVLTLLGERSWRIPSWLDRILPNIDIEGEALTAHLDSDTARTPDREPVLTL